MFATERPIYATVGQSQTAEGITTLQTDWA